MFNLNELSSSQWRIGNWIVHNEAEVLISTEKDIAFATGVSIASVSRFWKAVGFDNLKAFKQFLKEKREITPAKKLLNTMTDLEYSSLQSHHLNRSIHHLQATLNLFQKEAFEKAVASICTSNKLYIYAPGPSLGLGELLSYRLRRYGIDVRIVRWFGSEILEELLHINEYCTVMLFSFGRLLKEAEVLLMHAHQKNGKTIVISDQPGLESPIKYDIFLYADRGEKNEFHSMIAPLFLMENLIVEVGKAIPSLENMEQLDKLRKSFKDFLPR
ncbi:MurR/RpiR family transcriptional regulator [Niallia taxi]|uniref:MurR/RpiR family transcriptional regulator n=1 Tax=Niallia taxi TaxID=2499688 RepID=UPI003D2D148D